MEKRISINNQLNLTQSRLTSQDNTNQLTCKVINYQKMNSIKNCEYNQDEERRRRNQINESKDNQNVRRRCLASSRRSRISNNLNLTSLIVITLLIFCTTSSTSQQVTPTRTSAAKDNQEQCPLTAPEDIVNVMNAASKSYLAPIVFIGKLISLTEDYAGRIGATFKVSKQLKNIGSTPGTVPINLLPGTHVTTYYYLNNLPHQTRNHLSSVVTPTTTSRRSSLASIAPYCAIGLNKTQVDLLRPITKYIVYASPPLISLVEMHQRNAHAMSASLSAAMSNQKIQTTTTTRTPTTTTFLGKLASTTPKPLTTSFGTTASPNTFFQHLFGRSSASFGNIHGRRRREASSAALASNKTKLASSSEEEMESDSSDEDDDLGSFGHINYLSAFAPPDVFTRKDARAMKKTLCFKCGKVPKVRGLNGDFRIGSMGRLRLRCKVAGNPYPWVTWYRNGKKLTSRGRVVIYKKKKVSILEIRRVVPSLDTGYYECRARNVLKNEPAIGRVRVIVTRAKKTNTTTSLTTSTSTDANNLRNNNNNNNNHQVNPHPVQSIGPLPTPPSSGYWPIRGKDKPFVGLSDWTIRSCPIPDFCLNGGSCSFYESVGEYVCQCAEGFKGMRCEMKDIFSPIFRRRKR